MFGVDKGDSNAALAAILGMSHVKSVLEEAWKATRIMDGFDMEAGFKSKRYNENCSILKGICDQLGVSTSIDTPRTSTPRTSQNEPTSTARPYPTTTNSTFENRQQSSTSSISSGDGCVLGLVLSGLGLVIGGAIGGVGGAVVGALFGFGIWGKISD